MMSNDHIEIHIRDPRYRTAEVLVISRKEFSKLPTKVLAGAIADHLKGFQEAIIMMDEEVD